MVINKPADSAVIDVPAALLCATTRQLCITEPEGSMIAADQALDWLRLNGDPSPDGALRSTALRYAGVSRVILGLLDEALPLLFEGILVARAAHLSTDEAACMSAVGQAMGRFGEYESALTYLFGFLDKAQQIRSAPDICRALINIGNVYVALRDYPAALAKYREASTAWSGDAANKAILINNIGGTLGKMGRFQEAVQELQAALLQLGEAAPHPLFEGHIRCNLGEAFCRLGDLDQARAQLTQALQLARSAGGRREECQAMMQLGRLGLAHSQLADATAHLLGALQLAQEAGFRSIESEACELIAAGFEAEGKFDRALEYHRRYATIEEELHRSQSERRARALQIVLDFDLQHGLADAVDPKSVSRSSRPSESQGTDTSLPTNDSVSTDEPDDGWAISALASLTSRERQILALVAQGLSNKAIAEMLSLSGYTVRHHVSAILRKLGARTRAQAAAISAPRAARSIR